MTPDFVKAKEAAQRLFRLLDKVPPIDSSSNEGIRPVSKQHFCYSLVLHHVIILIVPV